MLVGHYYFESVSYFQVSFILLYTQKVTLEIKARKNGRHFKTRRKQKEKLRKKIKYLKWKIKEKKNKFLKS
jgi:hypothetical protein